MISDQERLEVAAKLREKKKDFFGVRSFFPQDIILYRSLYMQAIDECLPDGDCCFDVLAELIDVPTAKGIVEGRGGAVEYVPDAGTCRVVANDEGFLTCSNCGRIAAILSTASYCPNCGAKVVDE